MKHADLESVVLAARTHSRAHSVETTRSIYAAMLQRISSEAMIKLCLCLLGSSGGDRKLYNNSSVHTKCALNSLSVPKLHCNALMQ